MAPGNLSVRDVDNPARSPFQVSLCGGAAFLGGSAPSCGNLGLSTQVPANRRMVIGGTGAQYRVRFGLNALDSRFLEAAQPVRIYADAGTLVSMGTSFSSGAVAGSVGCTITLSGYTVAY